MWSRIRSIPRGVMWIAAVVVVVVLGGAWVWANYFQTYHLATVQPNVLYRDGMRSMREFETALNDVRPKMVVSLIDEHEIDQDPFRTERDYCRRAKIRCLRIPVKLGGWPTTANVRQFLDSVQVSKNQPALVHCAQGVRRTGMMVAAYQMSVMGWDKEKTKSAILTFGHSDRSIGDVKKFIDVYDPVEKTVPEGLPVGKE